MKYLNTSVCVFLIFLCSFSSAQSNKIDSLQNELDKSSADTSKANTLNSLAWEYRKVDAKKSLAFIKQALEHSQKINFEKGIGNSYSKYGDIYYFLGEYDTALDYYSKALTVREKINEQVGVAKCLQNIGDVYINIHDYKKGLDSYLKSLEIYQKLGEKKSFPLNNIALSYSYLGNYENAIKYYIKALETFEELEIQRWGQGMFI
jgi:tetratricopeptide (TPR) repeat protein